MNSEHTTPSKLTFKILRVRGEGNIWVTEYIITYDGGRPVNIITIMEFREGKVTLETLYFADPFEPPEWRSQWVQGECSYQCQNCKDIRNASG